jgi:AraC-like DNA-binding protein
MSLPRGADVTASLRSVTGETRDGLPISSSAHPSADLTRIVTRFFVMVIDQPAHQVVTDFLLNDTAFVRLLPRGHWAAEVAPGEWRSFDHPLLFGAQTRRLNVRVRGPMAALGFGISPGAWQTLFDEPADAFADTLLPLTDLWPEAEAALREVETLVDRPAAAVPAMEEIVRSRLARRGPVAIDSAMERFDQAAFLDPTRSVAEIAKVVGLSHRQLVARSREAFGCTPKTVLRRARFLDMAATMRGVATPKDEALAALRFYDQSHLTREMRHFTGMTPAEFLRTPTPMHTVGIEARQVRKAEELALLRPGTKAPWAA